MTQSIQPQGADLRSAVKWLSDNQDYSVNAIAQAAEKFDLSPVDAEFLIRAFANAGGSRTGS
jgi:hypothetical protein